MFKTTIPLPGGPEEQRPSGSVLPDPFQLPHKSFNDLQNPPFL